MKAKDLRDAIRYWIGPYCPAAWLDLDDNDPYDRVLFIKLGCKTCKYYLLQEAEVAGWDSRHSATGQRCWPVAIRHYAGLYRIMEGKHEKVNHT